MESIISNEYNYIEALKPQILFLLKTLQICFKGHANTIDLVT